MATKTKSDTSDPRIEAALRELAEMGVDVPTILKRLVEDERQLVALGGVDTALNLPRERAFDLPLMSPTLWFLLWSVRVLILSREEGSRKFEHLTATVDRLHDLFVTAISLKQGRGRRGRRKEPISLQLEREAKARMCKLCLLMLESQASAQTLAALCGCEELRFGLGLPVEAGVVGARARLAQEIKDKRALVNTTRKGRQGMSWRQAAGRVAAAWAEEITERSESRTLQRKFEL